MHRVYVAQDAKEAQVFLRMLESHDIEGRIIEDRDTWGRGEIHDVEQLSEVWIADELALETARQLALRFDDERLHPRRDETETETG